MLVRQRHARGVRGGRRNRDEALREPEERRAGAGGDEIARDLGQRGDRRRNDQELSVRCGNEVSRDGERIRQRNAGQIPVVGAPRGDRRRLRRIARVERD
jgi:hypothetical protein